MTLDAMVIRPKKLFPVTVPKRVFTQKNLYPKVFSALPTHNQHKIFIKPERDIYMSLIKHTFSNKKDNPKTFFY